MPSKQAGHVLVVGSLNVDLVMQAPRLPQPGETVLGGSFHVVPGGKGANQAVAAALLGVPVRMVGRIGADEFGTLVRNAVANAGVQVDHVLVDRSAPTGTAQITVDVQGHNAIVVASGANACVQSADVLGAESAWDGALVVVLQLEIPVTAVAATVATARSRGVPVLLNAAPARALPADLLQRISWLVVNEVEAHQLTGRAITSIATAAEAAAALRSPGQRIVVTLGADGAVLVNDSITLHVPAPALGVIDTTAAGDAFVGALAAAMHRGLDDGEALRQAVITGSLACTKPGAIPSLPTSNDVRAALLQMKR